MTHHLLLNELRRVALRESRLRWRRASTIAWLLIAVAGGVMLLPGVDPAVRSLGVPALCFLGIVITFIAWRVCNAAISDEHAIALQIEHAYPDLNARLLAALDEIEEHPIDRPMGFLQEQVVRQAMDHARDHDWSRIVPGSKLSRFAFLQFLAAGAMVAVLVTLILSAQAWSPSSPNDPNVITPAGLPADAPNTMTVEPGDTEVERGSSLIITARFTRVIPADVTLVVDDAAMPARSVPMSPSLNDPLVGARIGSVEKPLTYRVISEGLESKTFTVTVFEYPTMLQADATLTYPAYTGLTEKTIEDTRQVSAVEGTQLTWTISLNKPVAEAKLVAEDGTTLALKADGDAPSIVRGVMTVDRTRRFKVMLKDEADRSNKLPPELVVTALPNRAPELKLVFPRRDLRVSPIEETMLAAEAWDDFGVKAFGLSYALGGQEPNDIVLLKDAGAKTKHAAEHLLSFEAMGAQPEQLLSYYFWAEDIGPDGKVRRTMGDMYFAEVRHFEEIFREGQAPTSEQQQQQQQQQQNQQMQQIGELIKSQREIITATWNLIRREQASELSTQFVPDTTVIRDSQSDLMEKLTEVANNVSDPESLQHVQTVMQHMSEAVRHLTDALDKPAAKPLLSALPEEQAAAQALLKLQAREHEVIRQQQRQQQQQQGQQQQQAGPSQQQMNELELNNQENRYETQRLAQEQQQDPAQREVRQALNRLRDLARRQGDLNEKLKELELALQEAQTQQEREELERQLKRLRDQQEQVLRDLDELKDRMEQPQNQQQMAEAQEQVEQARQNARQASEALEQGMTSRALAEGTRAERKLEELREDFRQRASNQFAEDMQNMRREARELAQNQQDLGQKLEELDQTKQKTLRDQGDRKEIVDALDKQKQRLQDLKDDMKRVSESAEASQPLLSKELYDTLRQADQERVEQGLDVTRQLLDKGFSQEAREVEPQVRQSVNRIREGVEKAADSVLGDEAESLRRARDTVEQLARAAEREADRFDPQNAQQRGNQQQGQQPGQQQGQQPGQQQGQQPGQQQGQQPGQQQGQQPGQQQGQQPGQQQGQQPGQQQGQQPGQQQGQQPGQQQGQQPGQQQGQQPGQQQGQQPGQQQGQQPGQQQGQQPGQQQGQQPGQQQGQQPGQQQGQQPGQQPGQQQGQPGQQQGQPGQQQGQPSDQPGTQQASQPNQRGQSPGNPQRTGPRFLEQARSGAGGSGPHGPITGEDYRDWSDALRDVEELITDPELREEVARVRDRAKAMRAEFKKHGKDPQWDLVRSQIVEPLAELQNKLSDELARKDNKQPLVPIDRDPVPSQFSDLVKRYYEKIGSGD